MKKNRASLQMRRALAALTVNCLPTLDLADRRAEAAAREANILRTYCSIGGTYLVSNKMVRWPGDRPADGPQKSTTYLSRVSRFSCKRPTDTDPEDSMKFYALCCCASKDERQAKRYCRGITLRRPTHPLLGKDLHVQRLLVSLLEVVS